MAGVVPAVGRGGLQVHIVQQAGSVHLHAVQNMLLRRSRQEEGVHLQEERALPLPQVPVSFASLVFVASLKLSTKCLYHTFFSYMVVYFKIC